MKIKDEHYKQIVEAFTLHKDDIAKHRETLKEEKLVLPKDPEKRLRWDALHCTLGVKWVCDNIYPYANDDHLDTALRRAIEDAGLALPIKWHFWSSQCPTCGKDAA